MRNFIQGVNFAFKLQKYTYLKNNYVGISLNYEFKS